MRKTIITIMLTILLLFPLYSFADSIRVGLKYGSSAAMSYTLSSDSGFYMGVYKDGQFVPTMPVAAYTNLNAVCENGSVNLFGDDGNIVQQDFERYVIAAMDFDDGGVITADGKEYRGGIMFSINSTGSINMINVLEIDEYVYGVLNAEMHHDYPEEALKAQAVAARSFAVTNLNRHSQYGFDVCATTHCQVYKGYEDEYEETNAAVDDTAGLCIYSGGKVVSAYYFKNSGGYTQNINDVWGSESDYLKAVKDEYSPEYQWTATFSFDDIESKLESAGNSIGDIMRIEIVSRNESGAVDTLKFIGTGGEVSISKEKIRTLFDASVIKSTHFSFTEYNTGSSDASQGTAETGAQKIAMSSVNVIGKDGARLSLSAKNSVSVIGDDGEIEKRTLENIYAIDKSAALSAAGILPASSDIGQSGSVEYVTKSPVTFTGLGYGHGIGMPQDSAIEMAKHGFKYDEILHYYYTDIEIK